MTVAFVQKHTASNRSRNRQASRLLVITTDRLGQTASVFMLSFYPPFHMARPMTMPMLMPMLMPLYLLPLLLVTHLVAVLAMATAIVTAIIFRFVSLALCLLPPTYRHCLRPDFS
jgi:hypothetical protein